MFLLMIIALCGLIIFDLLFAALLDFGITVTACMHAWFFT